MPAIVLDLLKYVFLALLYVFVARAVKAIYAELHPAQSQGARRRKDAGLPPARTRRKPPGRVVVVEGDELKGRSFTLGEELVIGRAERCHVILHDDYVSQVHTRVFARNDGYMAEDLGSTNGTYINGRRINAAAEVHRGDRLKVGKTVLEMRK